MTTQVLKYFFSASDIMEDVRGHFRFYGMNGMSRSIDFTIPRTDISSSRTKTKGLDF